MRRTLPVAGVDLAATLGPLAILPGDPTVRLRPGRLERATLTPEGPAAIDVRWGSGDGAEVVGHGDGAAWVVERAAGLLGLEDDPSGFEPEGGTLRALWRRRRGERLLRTRTLWHDLAWAIVQQRVSGVDAAEQWRRLVGALGAPAPGPSGLRLPPDPTELAGLPYPELHRFGIERRRAEHLRHAARAAPRLAASVDGDVGSALPALRSVPGTGPWTASLLATHTWGHADTVIVGDHGIPSLVAWVLAGERRADDDRLLQLLEPHRPHRHRVVRLALASGSRPPRRHPRGHRHDIRGR